MLKKHFGWMTKILRILTALPHGVIGVQPQNFQRTMLWCVLFTNIKQYNSGRMLLLKRQQQKKQEQPTKRQKVRQFPQKQPTKEQPTKKQNKKHKRKHKHLWTVHIRPVLTRSLWNVKHPMEDIIAGTIVLGVQNIRRKKNNKNIRLYS